MDKIIVTALLIVAGVVTAVILYNTVYPAVTASGDALTRRQRQIDQRLQSQIEIIHAAPDGAVTNGAWVWVKNVGSQRISPIESCDVFFGPEENFSRLSYGDGDGQWTGEVENGTDWDPSTTLKITVLYTENLLDGTRYYVKVTTPNGVSDEYYFSK